MLQLSRVCGVHLDILISFCADALVLFMFCIARAAFAVKSTAVA